MKNNKNELFLNRIALKTSSGKAEFFCQKETLGLINVNGHKKDKEKNLFFPFNKSLQKAKQWSHIAVYNS